MPGCPANEATTDEAALTPQKIAKTEGYKDSMKELKKLTTFQDKAARGAKPKGFSDQWAVRVSVTSTFPLCTTDDPYLTLVDDNLDCWQRVDISAGMVDDPCLVTIFRVFLPSYMTGSK